MKLRDVGLLFFLGIFIGYFTFLMQSKIAWAKSIGYPFPYLNTTFNDIIMPGQKTSDTVFILTNLLLDLTIWVFLVGMLFTAIKKIKIAKLILLIICSLFSSGLTYFYTYIPIYNEIRRGFPLSFYVGYLDYMNKSNPTKIDYFFIFFNFAVDTFIWFLFLLSVWFIFRKIRHVIEDKKLSGLNEVT